MYENGKFFTACEVDAKQIRAAYNTAEYLGRLELKTFVPKTKQAVEMMRLICLTLRYFTEIGATKKSISLALGMNADYCRDAIREGKKLLKESPEFADKLRDFAIIYNNEHKRLTESL